jgi:hypothetical protein
MIHKSENCNNKPKVKPPDIILIGLFFSSIGLTIWGINIYRLTIIDSWILIATIAFGMVVVSATLSLFLISSYGKFWTHFLTAVIGGGIFYFSFLLLNQRFASNKLSIERFDIIKKGSLPSGRAGHCSQPYVVIDFHNTEKQLVFYCHDADLIKLSTSVTLVYSKGAFGFNIIRSQRLTN